LWYTIIFQGREDIIGRGSPSGSKERQPRVFSGRFASRRDDMDGIGAHFVMRPGINRKSVVKAGNRCVLVLLCFMAGFLLSSCGGKSTGSDIWVEGVENPRIPVTGRWKLHMDPPEDFWAADLEVSGWDDVEVPGELAAQGYGVEHDGGGYALARDVLIPEDYAGKRIFLRFDGVYSHCRVWINGTFIREHHGGFTTWRCDITGAVAAGETARLVVQLTDRLDDISYGSGYAHHPIGGILRDVFLEARPPGYIDFIHIQTDLDETYTDAVLLISAGAVLPEGGEGEIHFSLTDGRGRRVALAPRVLALSGDSPRGRLAVPVKNPLTWDAEHPRLYRLRAELRRQGRAVEWMSQNIGFREVEVRGNRLLVNGRPVKLRGANRHDIHPLLGRRTTAELDELDVRLAKEAHINFIRTSHYPPSSAFLGFCDRYGLFVEEETAVCFVGTHRSEPYRVSGATEDNPAFSRRYLDQLAEMVVRDRNHPSVIIWSIGNENLYGRNFQDQYDWLKAADPSRPIIFSYPGRVPEGRACYDILSMHYPSWEGDLTQYGLKTEGFAFKDKPVLFDEWAHVPCYNTATLREDPNVSNFWGESLDRFWAKAFEADGALGGAVWGMIDEVFLLPGRSVGYGPWGIIDGWRRKKPEFWHVRKAYSPVRVEQTRFPRPPDGGDLEVPLFNRFDFTDFAELEITWQRDGKKGRLPLSLAPHNRGVLKIPGQDWNTGGDLRLSFVRDGILIEEELISLGDRQISPPEQGSVFRLSEIAGRVFVDGRRLGLGINPANGLIRRGGNSKAWLAGPFLHLIHLEKEEGGSGFRTRRLDGVLWDPHSVDISADTSSLEVIASGWVEGRQVSLRYTLNDKGLLQVDYTFADPPKEMVREIGVAFLLPDDARSISWEREAQWTLYPEDHIGRPSGFAALEREDEESYGVKPSWPWGEDGRDFFLFGLQGFPGGGRPLIRDAKGLKTGLHRYSVSCGEGAFEIHVVGGGEEAARVYADEQGFLYLAVLNGWDYKSLDWGNYERDFTPASPFTGRVTLRLVEAAPPARR
jgi:beta-galactosidase